MAYILEALLSLAGFDRDGTPSQLRLGGDVVMFPLTNANRSWVRAVSPVSSVDPVPGFDNLDLSVAAFARERSAHGRIVYVQKEFWAGSGFEAALGWDAGEVAFGPMFTATNESDRPSGAYRVVPQDEWAINQSLQFLGVHRSDEDEFDTVGLGLHRHTDDW